VAAIGAGGNLPALIAALHERERRRADLKARVVTQRSHAPAALEPRRIQLEMPELAAQWRHVLADDATKARPIVTSLLKGHVTFEPLAKLRWKLTGEGILTGLFSQILSLGMASPPERSAFAGRISEGC